MTEGEARFMKEYSRDNRWGIASIGGRLGVCMDVVKIDSCEPDWDYIEMQYGFVNLLREAYLKRLNTERGA